MPETIQHDHSDPDDAAVLAGVDVEQPSDTTPADTHTTRTLEDLDPTDNDDGSLLDNPQGVDQQDVAHPVGEKQARENADNEPAG